MVYVNIAHTKQLLSYQAPYFSGLGWCTSYDSQATATKLSVTVSKDALPALSLTSGLLFNYFGRGKYSRPHLDY